MQMLRKQLEESKARQAAEASSRQDLENIVAGLQRELEERDVMIQNLQMGSVSGSVTSSVIGSPFVMSPDHGSPMDSPGNTTPPAGNFSTYFLFWQPCALHSFFFSFFPIHREKLVLLLF